MGTASAPASSVVVLGAGRQAVETAGYAAEAGLEVAGHVEEYASGVAIEGSSRGGLTAAVHTFDELLASGAARPLISLPAICAVGDPMLRARMTARWSELVQRLTGSAGPSFASIVSAHAWLASDVRLGVGVTIAPGAYLNRFAQVGDHTLVNVGAIISHDVILGDFVTVSPGSTVGGAVEVGDSAYLGIGCTVRDHIRIGRGAMVGAGAVVVSDVADGVTVIGVPARPRADR